MTDHKEVPAIDCAVQMAIGPTAQITLRTFIERDADDAVANAILDKMVKLAERQKAKTDIEVLEQEIRDHQKTLENLDRNAATLDARYNADKGAREREVEALNKQITDIAQAAADEWARGGRQGDYKLRGQSEANANRLKAEILKVKQAQDKDDDERSRQQVDLATNRKRFLDEIATRRAAIAKRLELIGGEPVLREAAE